MNEQKAPAGIEWTRVRNPDGTVRRGFTWNVMTGCLHDCEWTIDGQWTECYAKTLAERMGRGYPQGFASYYFHPDRLYLPLKQKEPAGIFPDSQSDMFGHWVLSDHRDDLELALEVIRIADWHIFQPLTKNTRAYRRVENLPRNLWLGISSPPDHFMGKDLNDTQKEAFLRVALETLSLKAAEGYVTWMSFEPLSRDWAHVVAEYPGALKWAVVGAASLGKRYYAPVESHVRNLLDVLDSQNIPTFFKGNMRSLAWARDNWREAFPVTQPLAATPDPTSATER